MGAVHADLKVLDLSWGVAGPMTAMLLADHGAQVTRIIRPAGDPFGSPLGYKVWHRGKDSAVLDLKDAGDAELFQRLAADADVVIQSFAPGVAERLGVDHATLSRRNPRLITVAITAYGESGPDAGRKGYDALVAARSGLQWEQRGWPEGAVWHMAGAQDPFADIEIDPSWVQGAERDGPLAAASPWPSLGAFFSATAGLAAALFARERTGRGQKVSTSLYQGALACGAGVWQKAEDYEAEGFNSWILGSRSPKGHFECADGRWVHNWVPNPRFILESAKGETLGATPDLTVQNDPDRFGVGPEELVVMAHYQPILADAVKRFNAADWVEAARIAEMTMQECRSIEESLADPLLHDDGCVTVVDDPELGAINQVGITYRLETSPGAVPGPAHPDGADTAAVKARAAALPLPEPSAAPAPAPDTPPLDGIRVVDLGLAIAGPFGCQLLADMGADVIKVNTLWDGYWHRMHIAYMANRGKRSLSLMLKHPGAMEALHRLLATADVVMHNMRYGAVERLGLDYATLKEKYPRLVYCHSRGFEDGPRKNLPGNDQTGACLAGIQYADGGMQDGGKPLWSLTSLGDTGNGFLAAAAICNALMERERTGRGQFVDTSIVNACLLNTSYAVAGADGRAFDYPKVDAGQHGFGPANRLYRTADGQWVQVDCHTDAERAAWARFAGDDGVSATARLDATALLAALAEAGVPAELSDGEASRRLYDREDLRQRQWTVEYPHKLVGSIAQIGRTYDLSGAQSTIDRAPLVVGKESAELLAELGYDDAGIDALATGGAILCDPPRAGQQTMASPWAT